MSPNIKPHARRAALVSSTRRGFAARTNLFRGNGRKVVQGTSQIRRVVVLVFQPVGEVTGIGRHIEVPVAGKIEQDRP